MSKVEMLNLAGEKVKEIKIKTEVWGIEPNDAVLHNAIVLARANARQGSIRAPQWRGGGVVFGPTPNKNYSKKQNKKERRLAVLSALSYKVIDNELVVVDSINFETNKTKEMVGLLSNLNLVNKKVLVVVEELTENVCLASRNLANVKLVTFNEVNAYDVVNADNMLITEAALNKLEEVLTRE